MDTVYVLGVDCAHKEHRILAALVASFTVIINTGHEVHTRTLAEMIDIESLHFAPEATGDYTRERAPLPRPSKAQVKVNQAPRQSIRKTMRSVNRNR